jgi:hypothetical protein
MVFEQRKHGIYPAPMIISHKRRTNNRSLLAGKPGKEGFAARGELYWTCRIDSVIRADNMLRSMLYDLTGKNDCNALVSGGFALLLDGIMI